MENFYFYSVFVLGIDYLLRNGDAAFLQFSLKLLIHHMGGRVRKETNSETTHLVAKICKGEKYSYAMLFNVPVVSETWLYDAWEKRNVVGFNAADPDFVS